MQEDDLDPNVSCSVESDSNVHLTTVICQDDLIKDCLMTLVSTLTFQLRKSCIICRVHHVAADLLPKYCSGLAPSECSLY